MKKFTVYGLYTAYKKIGEYEAESPEEAAKKAESDQNADVWISLCHQCAKEIELNDDPYKYQAEEI